MRHRDFSKKIVWVLIVLFASGIMEFPIVKDTTPNITYSRLNNIP